MREALDRRMRDAHTWSMDETMKRTIDQILERIKDPESGLPISNLGVVERIRYNAEKQELYIFTNFLKHSPGCLACVGVAATVVDGIQRRLLEAFQSAFPDLKILFV